MEKLEYYPLSQIIYDYAKLYDDLCYEFKGLQFNEEVWDKGVREYFRVVYGVEVGDSVDYFGAHLVKVEVLGPANPYIPPWRFPDTRPLYTYLRPSSSSGRAMAL